jgi:hypothetical protein
VVGNVQRRAVAAPKPEIGRFRGEELAGARSCDPDIDVRTNTQIRTSRCVATDWPPDAVTRLSVGGGLGVSLGICCRGRTSS